MASKEKIPPLPHHLGHKPIVSIEYAEHDGPYSSQTDAMYISLGTAQWSGEEFSAKVWRFVGDRWSRQSEELPLHRIIDLAILIAVALRQVKSGLVRFPANTFENQKDDIHAGVFARFDPPAATQKLLRNRLLALVRTIASEHPDVMKEGLKQVDWNKG
jgi:hypothetical protein